MSNISDADTLDSLWANSDGLLSPLTTSPEIKSKVEGQEHTGRGSSEAAEEDFAALFAMETYKNLSSISRPLLKEMNERFLNDPLFRSFVTGYLRPSTYLNHEDDQFFRFMDLPTELRIKIAEYALHSAHGLEWKRKSFDPDKRIGEFREIDAFGLTRVSRQLRAETKDIIFKVNTLNFRGNYMGSDCKTERTYNAISEYRHFKSCSTPAILGATRSISLCIGYDFNILHALKEFRQVADAVPTMRMRLLWKDWCIAIFAGSKSRVENFMEIGHALQEALSDGAFSPQKRSRRVYPSRGVEEVADHLNERLSSEDLQIAVEWFKYGL